MAIQDPWRLSEDSCDGLIWATASALAHADLHRPQKSWSCLSGFNYLIKSFWFGGYLQSLKQILRYCTESPVLALSCQPLLSFPLIKRFTGEFHQSKMSQMEILHLWTHEECVSNYTPVAAARRRISTFPLPLLHSLSLLQPNCIDCTVYHSCVATLRRIWCGLLQTEPPMDHLLLHLAQVQYVWGVSG